MLKKFFFIILFGLLPYLGIGQVVNRTTDNNFKGTATFGTGTDIYTPTDPSAILQLGENGTNKGLLMPRVLDTANVANPANGLTVFQTSDNAFYIEENGKWVSYSTRIDTVATIQDLEAYAGNAYILDVTDSLRGGLFYLSNAGTPDSGTIFPANGLGSGMFWKRNIINNTYYITWFGAIGKSYSIDNTAAIQNCFNAAAKTSASQNNLRSTVIINQPTDSIYSYATYGTLKLSPNVNLLCNAKIFYFGSDTALIIGNSSSAARDGNYKIQVITSPGYNNWSTTSLGVEMINIEYSNISLYVGGFRTDVSLEGNGIGNVYNKYNILYISDFAYGIVLRSLNGGWCNENNFYGGEFSLSSSVSPMPFEGINSYAVYIDDGNNDNKFYSPSFELSLKDTLGSEAIPVYIKNGSENIFSDARVELSSVPVIKVLSGNNNYFTSSYYSPNSAENPIYTLLNDSSSSRNNYATINSLLGRKNYDLIFNSGFLPSKVIQYNSSSFSLRGFDFIDNSGIVSPNTTNLISKDSGVSFFSYPFPFIKLNTGFSHNFIVSPETDTGNIFSIHIQAINENGTTINPVNCNCIFSKNLSSEDSTSFGKGSAYLFSYFSNPIAFSVSDTVKKVNLILESSLLGYIKSFSVYSSNNQKGSEYSGSDTTKNIMGLAQSVPTQTFPSGTWIKNDFSDGSNAIFWYNNNGTWDSLTNNAAVTPNLHNVLLAGDTATNDIKLGSDGQINLGSTTGGNAGILQYQTNAFQIHTTSLTNPVWIDGNNVAIGGNNASEPVGIGTQSPSLSYKLDVAGNSLFENNVSVNGDSLDIWPKTYTMTTTIQPTQERIIDPIHFTAIDSVTSPTNGIDFHAGIFSMELDNTASVNVNTFRNHISSVRGSLALNLSGTSTKLWDQDASVSGLEGTVSVFNNANYENLASITATAPYTFTQGSYTKFSGVVDSFEQVYLPISPTDVTNMDAQINNPFGILQKSIYPNHFSGGVQLPIRNVTTSTTITTADYTVINISGTNTFTMPTAASCIGQIFHFVCRTGTITLSVGYLNYAGSSTTSIAASSGVTIQSDGTNFNEIGQ